MKSTQQKQKKAKAKNKKKCHKHNFVEISNKKKAKKAKLKENLTPSGPRVIKENIFDVVMPWKKEKPHYNKHHLKGPEGLIIHQENVLKYDFEGIKDL